MRKILTIAILVAICFFIEFVAFNFLGRWFKPNLSLILLVFFNFYWGTQYGVMAAVLAGVIKDSFSVTPFGLNIVSFIVCVYITSFLRRHFYYLSSSTSRIQIVIILCFVNTLVQYFISALHGSVSFWQVVNYVMIPETLMTALVAGYAFLYIKDIAVKFTL